MKDFIKVGMENGAQRSPVIRQKASSQELAQETLGHASELHGKVAWTPIHVPSCTQVLLSTHTVDSWESTLAKQRTRKELRPDSPTSWHWTCAASHWTFAAPWPHWAMVLKDWWWGKSPNVGRALSSTLGCSLLMREAYKGNPGQQQMTRPAGQGLAMNQTVTSRTGSMRERAHACICGVFVLPHDRGKISVTRWTVWLFPWTSARAVLNHPCAREHSKVPGNLELWLPLGYYGLLKPVEQ